MAKCCAPNCSNTQKRDSNKYGFYGFPEDPGLRAAWMSQIGRLNWIPGRRSLICSTHFESHFLESTESSLHLCVGAIPTIFETNKRKRNLARVVETGECLPNNQNGIPPIDGESLAQNSTSVQLKSQLMGGREKKKFCEASPLNSNGRLGSGPTVMFPSMTKESSKVSSNNVKDHLQQQSGKQCNNPVVEKKNVVSVSHLRSEDKASAKDADIKRENHLEFHFIDADCNECSIHCEEDSHLNITPSSTISVRDHSSCIQQIDDDVAIIKEVNNKKPDKLERELSKSSYSLLAKPHNLSESGIYKLDKLLAHKQPKSSQKVLLAPNLVKKGNVIFLKKPPPGTQHSQKAYQSMKVLGKEIFENSSISGMKPIAKAVEFEKPYTQFTNNIVLEMTKSSGPSGEKFTAVSVDSSNPSPEVVDTNFSSRAKGTAMASISNRPLPEMAATVSHLFENQQNYRPDFQNLSQENYVAQPEMCHSKVNLNPRWQNDIQMCRICGIASDSTVDIFSEDAIKLKLQQRISAVLPIKITKNDGLPHGVCLSCISRLDACSQLIITSLNTQKQLSNSGKEFDQVFDVSNLHGMDAMDGSADVNNGKDMKKKILIMEICHSEEKSVQECLALAVEDIGIRLLPEDQRLQEPSYRLAVFSLHKNSQLGCEEQIKNALSTFIEEGKLKNTKQRSGQGYMQAFSTEENHLPMSVGSKQTFIQGSTTAYHKPVSCSKEDSHSNHYISKTISQLGCHNSIRDFKKPDSYMRGTDATVRLNNVEQGCISIDLTTNENCDYVTDNVMRGPKAPHTILDHDFVLDGIEVGDTNNVVHPPENLTLPVIDNSRTYKFNVGNIRVPKLTSVWKNRNTTATSLQGIFSWKLSSSNDVQLICKLCQHIVSDKESPQSHLEHHKEKCGLETSEITVPVKSDSQKLWKYFMRKKTCFHYLCSFCCERFKTRQGYTQHLQKHTKSKCRGCGYKAANFQEALSHYRSCPELKPKRDRQCKQCAVVFLSTEELKKHMAESGHENMWLCDTCGKKFTEIQKLSIHKKIHRPADIRLIHQCPHCPKRFEYLSKLRQHNQHHGERSFMCQDCGKMFRALQTLRQHEKTHGDPKFSCPHCSHKFFRNSHLLLHLKVHESGCTRKHRSGRSTIAKNCLNRCRECKQVFSIGELLVHYKNAHPNSPLDQFTCNTCCKENTSYGELLFHQRVAHKQNLTECPFCSKSLVSAARLQYHVMKHEGLFPFYCNICNRGCTSNSLLQDHMRRFHTKEKPYKCKFCSKSFPSNSSLAQHKDVHKGPHQMIRCPICNQGFKRKAHLDVHMRTHTGAKPYQCPLCERPFRQRTDCQKHIRAIHGQDPFQYDINANSDTGVSQIVPMAVDDIELVLGAEDLMEGLPPS